MLLPSERKYLVKHLLRSEGNVSHMYLDTAGKVTVGIGHYLANTEVAVKIKFYVRGTDKLATPEEIRKEFRYVKKQKPGRVYRYYEQFTNLYIKEETIRSLFKFILKKKEENLKTALKNVKVSINEEEEEENVKKKYKKYPVTIKYDTLPGKVKMALLDMAYNMGANKLATQFPKFLGFIYQAQKDKNLKKYKEAIKESGRNTNDPRFSSRNRFVANLLEIASKGR